MLRISIKSDDRARLTLRVEGRITGAWVGVLEQECRGWLARRRSVRLDLSDVAYVDSDGGACLRRLCADGVDLVRCPALIRDMLVAQEDGP